MRKLSCALREFTFVQIEVLMEKSFLAPCWTADHSCLRNRAGCAAGGWSRARRPERSPAVALAALRFSSRIIFTSRAITLVCETARDAQPAGGVAPGDRRDRLPWHSPPSGFRRGSSLLRGRSPAFAGARKCLPSPANARCAQ